MLTVAINAAMKINARQVQTLHFETQNWFVYIFNNDLHSDFSGY